jgi:hypothetical protein
MVFRLVIIPSVVSEDILVGFSFLGNIVTAICVAAIAGAAFSMLWLTFLYPFWSKIRSPEFRSKWYL